MNDDEVRSACRKLLFQTISGMGLRGGLCKWKFDARVWAGQVLEND